MKYVGILVNAGCKVHTGLPQRRMEDTLRHRIFCISGANMRMPTLHGGDSWNAFHVVGVIVGFFFSLWLSHSKEYVGGG